MRRAGEWVGSCFTGLFIFGYAALLLFGLVMWVVDLVFWDDPPSSTSSTVSTAAPTTGSTLGSSTWTTGSSTTEPSRTLRTVPPSFWARHYRIGARCRDGWRSDATGSGACSHHGGVAEWLYADDRIVHETRTGREIGTVKWSAPIWADTYAKRPITTCRSTRLPRCAMRPSRSGSGSAYRHARARPRPVRLLLPTGPVIRVERADGRVDHRGSPPLAHSASRHASDATPPRTRRHPRARRHRAGSPSRPRRRRSRPGGARRRRAGRAARRRACARTSAARPLVPQSGGDGPWRRLEV
jgi:hypothetical protein